MHRRRARARERERQRGKQRNWHLEAERRESTA